MKDIFKSLYIDLIKAKAAIGEIREWRGIKYQKQINGTWKPLRGQNVKKNRYPKLEESYGINYSQYQNNPIKAIEFLLEKKEGQVIGAYEKKGFGKIDIIWGDDKKGLNHIWKRHFVEQDDFSSYEDMAKKITDVLENGKISKLSGKENKVGLYKDDYVVFLVRDVVYNEEDDFRDKIWILTSYDKNRSKEEKIRKAISNETALEKDPITLCPCNSSVNSRKNHLEQGRTNIVIAQCSFSDCKDTLRKSLEQHLDNISFEKAKKGYDVGTIKEFGGKKYIKTNNGWKYYSNKSQSQKKETKEDKKDTPTAEYLQQVKKWAEEASVAALKNAINNENTKDFVKEIAKEELLKRKQKLKETETQVKKEEVASKQVKKITQTYVKVNGDQIIIKMKNESQYKATKGSFKLESEVGEDLVSFKKKVIESYSNKDKTEQKDKIVEQPSKKTTLHFDDNYERDSYLKKSAHYDLLSNETKAIIKEQLEKRTDKIKKTIGNEDFDKIYKPIFIKIKDKMSLTNFYRDILREYGDTRDEINRVCINKALVELGYAPIANGLLFKRYGNTTYIDYSMYHHYALNDKYDGSRNKTIDNSTQDERDSLSLYTGSSYKAFRRCLNGNPYEGEMSKYKSDIENITKMIDKNRLTDNIVLVRRLEFKGTNNLNKWLSLEEGDIIVDKSFTSFSLIHQTFFGNDFSITLLAKKGDPVMNALNSGELEYIVQRGTKFKVLEKGLNSVVVTIV